MTTAAVKYFLLQIIILLVMRVLVKRLIATTIITGVVLDRIFMFVVSDPSILPIWPLLIAL